MERYVPHLIRASDLRPKYGTFRVTGATLSSMTENDSERFAVALGEEIRHWRDRRHLSREELADLAGTSGTTVGRIERGDTRTNVSTTWAIVRELGVDFADVVRRAEEVCRLDQPSMKQRASVRQEIDAALGSEHVTEQQGRDGRNSA